MSDMLLEVVDLKKHFPVRRGVFSRVVGQVRAVDGISFHIRTGETLGLVGESGCGKTTTGRVVLRLMEPTSGRVQFEGNDVAAAGGSQLRALRKNMQVVFQDPYGSLNPRMTIRSTIEEGLIVHRQGDRRARLRRVEEVLQQVGLDPSYLNRYPHEFSGGQRQRICVARALALSPRFMVLDEPLSALDVSIQSQIINLLVELKQKFKLTYLLISHDLSVVEYISDRVAVMYVGEIVETATSEALYKSPLHPYTIALLSSIPTVDPSTKPARIVLQGDVPSPVNPPAGCRFHPRCPLAMDICRTQSPRALEFEGHIVRCHAVDQATADAGQDTAQLSKVIRAQIDEKGLHGAETPKS